MRLLKISERVLSYSTFVYWRSRLLSENKQANVKEAKMEFAVVKVNLHQNFVKQSEIKIRLPTGVIIIIERETDSSHIKQIILLVFIDKISDK